jgi:threonine/homoserine/homoserine lactone efflux protein
VSLLAPKPKLKKTAKDAVIAPSPKRWVSENWVDIEPSIITVSTQFSETHLFGLGAITASFAVFFSLGFGASRLTSYFEKPRTWQILEVCIGAVMIILGINLLI